MESPHCGGLEAEMARTKASYTFKGTQRQVDFFELKANLVYILTHASQEYTVRPAEAFMALGWI